MPAGLTMNPRRAPVALWLVLGAWAAMLASYLVITPLYQGPDEPQHIDRILDTGAFSGFEEWDEGQSRLDIQAATRIWRCCFFPPPFDERGAPEEPRPSFRDLGPDDPQVGTDQQTQHPPLYYSAMGAVRTAITGMTPDDLWSADREVTLLRFLNLLLVLPIPLLAWRGARELGWGERESLLASMVPLVIPQLAWIGVTVNNDNLVALLASVAVVASCRILRRGLDMRTALVFGGSIALALMTKASALLLLPYAALVVAIAWRRRGVRWWPMAVLGGLGLLGSWFYVRAVVLYADPVPSRGGPPTIPDAVVDVGAFIEAFARKTSASFWGNFGWLAYPSPVWWSYVLMGTLVATLIWVVARDRDTDVRVVMAPFFLAVVLMVYVTYQGHVKTGLFPAMQGRYLFIAIVPVAVGVAAAVRRWTEIGRRGLSLLAVVNYVLAVVTIFRAYWKGGGLAKIGPLVAWSPLGVVAAVVFFGGTVALVGFLAAVEWVERRPSGHGRQSDEAEPALVT